MFRRMPGLVALSFVLMLSAARPVAAHPGGDGHERMIVAERFLPGNGVNAQIVAVRPSDGQVQVLTSGNRDFHPDLSPDGRRIVFESCPNAVDCGEIGKVNIWIMKVDGTDAHPLVACDGTPCLGSFDPAFSPDGRLITFSEDRLDENGVNVNGIFIMRTDGTHVRRVTSNGQDSGDGDGSFSPDSRHLVFTHVSPNGQRLMIVGVDGKGLRPLLPDVDGSSASWSPDGSRIAFTLFRPTEGGGFTDLATVEPDGRHLRRITDEEADGRPSFTPDYSPTGRRLVFSEGTDTGCRIATIDDTGRRRRVVTADEEACYANPTW